MEGMAESKDPIGHGDTEESIALIDPIVLTDPIVMTDPNDLIGLVTADVVNSH